MALSDMSNLICLEIHTSTMRKYATFTMFTLVFRFLQIVQ